MMKKKLWSLIVSSLMLIVLFPMTAKAGSSEWEALNSAFSGSGEQGECFTVAAKTSGYNITLTDNIICTNLESGPLVISSGQNITLIMNGYSLNRAVGETAIDDGYVIKVENGAKLTIRNENMTTGAITGGNNTGNGGGIYNEGTVEMVYKSVINGNKADGNGGGIYNNGGIIKVYESAISNNTAVNGGGLYNTANGTFVLSGAGLGCHCTIDSNIATQNGGGVYNESGSVYVPAVNNCIAECGGAVYTVQNAKCSGVALKGCSAKDSVK